MYWLEAVRKSKVDRAVRSYDEDRELVRNADGSCFLRYKDTGLYSKGFGDSYAIEGYMDWEPDVPGEGKRE